MNDVKLLGLLNRLNPWWDGQGVPDAMTEEHRRRDFHVLRKRLNGDRTLAIRGPRQVGKTTVVGQLIEELIRERGVPPERILYVTTDASQIASDPGNIVDDAIACHEEYVLEKAYDRVDTPIYLFFDEIQDVPNWSSSIKLYTDRFDVLNVTVTGSVSTLIKRNAEETLAGRLDDYVMMPMKFADRLEYDADFWSDDFLDRSLSLRRRLKESAVTGDASAFRNELAGAYGGLETYRPEFRGLKDEHLLKGGYPATLSSETSAALTRIDSDLQSIVLGDIPSVFSVEKPQGLMRVLGMIAESTGSKINVQRIVRGSDLNRETVEHYLEYLSEFFLCDRIHRFSTSAYDSGGKAKVYVPDTGVLNAINGATERTLSDAEQMGPIFETACFDHIKRLQFYLSDHRNADVAYWDAYGEVDFVLEGGDYLLPIEVKHGDSTSSNLKGIKRFLEETDAPFGLVVNNADVLEQEGDLLHVPGWLFLFLC